MASSSPPHKLQSEPHISEKLLNESKPLTATAFYAIKAFGYTRIALGVASLLAPRFTCGLFAFHISDETATVVRMFGVRGVALGELLVTADDKTSLDEARRELRRLLQANVGCDMADICSIAFAVVNGHMASLPAALLAGGAAGCVGMGLLGLKTV
jgi:hypothetical protein